MFEYRGPTCGHRGRRSWKRVCGRCLQPDQQPPHDGHLEEIYHHPSTPVWLPLSRSGTHHVAAAGVMGRFPYSRSSAMTATPSVTL